MRNLVLLVAMTVAIGVMVAHYADKAVNAPNSKSTYSDAITTSPSSVTSVIAPPPQPPPSSSSQAPSKPALPQVITLSPSRRSVTLRDDGSGHFRTDARVDGRRVEFMVDTGATAVVLRASTAARLGIHPARSEYTARVITGNGETRAAVVQLNSVEIGDIIVRDVRALVQSDETLGLDLLGMTFLSRVRWTYDRGRLVIEQ
jgi:aspartyl protease family protein